MLITNYKPVPPPMCYQNLTGYQAYRVISRGITRMRRSAKVVQNSGNDQAR